MSRPVPGGNHAGQHRLLLLFSPEGPTPAARLRMRRWQLVYTGRGETCGVWLQGVCVVLQAWRCAHIQTPSWRGAHTVGIPSLIKDISAVCLECFHAQVQVCNIRQLFPLETWNQQVNLILIFLLFTCCRGKPCTNYLTVIIINTSLYAF